MANKKISQLSSSLAPPLSGVTVVVHDGTTYKSTLSTLKQVLVDSSSHSFTGSQVIGGNLTVSGSVTAQQFILSSSIANIVTETISGSSNFGNSIDDRHIFTGSVRITGSLSTTGSFNTIGDIRAKGTIYGDNLIAGDPQSNFNTIKLITSDTAFSDALYSSIYIDTDNGGEHSVGFAVSSFTPYGDLPVGIIFGGGTGSVITGGNDAIYLGEGKIEIVKDTSVNGTLTIGEGIIGEIPEGLERLHVGSSGSINIAHFQGDNEYYAQVNLFNINSGSFASTDLVLTADNGNEVVHYVNIGINSSTYDGGEVGYDNDAYLINAGKDLYLGTLGGSYHPAEVKIFTMGNWYDPQMTLHSADNKISFNTTGTTEGYTYNFSGSLNLLHDINIDGITNLGSTSETIVPLNEPTTGYTHDFSSGAILYVTEATSNITVDVVNVPTNNNKGIGLTVMIEQGSTAYMVDSLKINSDDEGSVDIMWYGGSLPSGNANSYDIVSFSILKVNSLWKVFGQMTTFSESNTPPPSPTPTRTVTPTSTVTPTPTPSLTPTNSQTPTMSPTPSETTALAPSATPTMSMTPTSTVTSTPSETPTMTPSETPTMTPSGTPGATPSETPSMTPSETPTMTPTMTPSETPTMTPSETPTMTMTPSETPTMTPSETPTMTMTPSETPTMTPTMTMTPSETPTMTPTMSITPSETPTMTPTMTMTPSPTSPMVTVGEWYLTGDEGLYSGPGSGATYDENGTAFFSYGGAGPNLTNTYNPNFLSNDYSALYFNTKNSAGVQYLPLFQSLKDNGGTFSVTQNSNTARFTVAAGFNYIYNLAPDSYMFVISESGGITQTQESPNPFVFGTPFTITFRG